MSVNRLTNSEQELVKAIERGKEYRPKQRAKIAGEVLRNVMLGLPLSTSVTGRAIQTFVCKRTGAGIRIENVVIDGRIDLDSVVGCDGQPLCPLALRACTLKGGFSAGHARFSRLSLRDCSVVDLGVTPNPIGGGERAPIDLSGARFETSLDLTGIHPEGKTSLLWIRAAGIEVNGDIDLSKCQLRAPLRTENPGAPDETRDALDLTLARIEGDLILRDGVRLDGRFKMRNASVRGDLWLRSAKIRRRHAEEAAVFMQGSRIGGLLVMDCVDDPGGRLDPLSFVCLGDVNLAGVTIGRSARLYGAVEDGELIAHDLVIKLDFYLGAEVEGDIDLRDARIGGTLNLAELRVGQNAAGDLCETRLNLARATIGRTLQLRREPSSVETAEDEDAGTAEPLAAGASTGFRMSGRVGLEGASCRTLDDGVGIDWGNQVQIDMDQFVYRETAWQPERSREPERLSSHQIFGNWLLAKWADGRLPLPAALGRRRLARHNYWQPWQRRRNWIYQMFGKPSEYPISISRHKITEEEYRSQPFEQAVRVAWTEGREEFATHFEMLKKRIEWGLFNRNVRWWLAVAAIVLASIWLMFNHETDGGTLVAAPQLAAVAVALTFTLAMMIWASTLHRALTVIIRPRWLSHAAIWLAFFVPAGLLFVHPPWRDKPFHFLIALAIFLAVRCMALIAHAVMRFCFGYLRRPMNAVATLVLAFLLGWWAVHVANVRDMLVIAAEPVADLAATDSHAKFPAGHGTSEAPILMGSRRVPESPSIAREISCAATISEPLYALDVLIPIVDLHEESRCEIRRVPAHDTHIVEPGMMSFGRLLSEIPNLPFNDHRFWWWMKALYAVLGWILVSLAILTFAQVNKTHAEASMEGE